MLLFWSLTAVTKVLSVVLVPVSDNTNRVLQQLLKCSTVVLVSVSDNTYIVQLLRRSFAPLVMELNYIFLQEFTGYVFLWNWSK